MIKRFTFRKIAITSLLLLLSLILYSFPKELEEDISDVTYEKINVYLIDGNNYVAMTDIDIKDSSFDTKIRSIIKSLTVGNSSSKGFYGVIPKSTKLLSYSLSDGLLKVDFSKDILNVSLNNENKMIESIVYSLTSLKDVEKIMIFVEGERLNELPKSHKRLDLYLDRSYGINKVIDISTFSDTQLVNVYYLSEYEDKYYYVPVSYLVDGDQERIEIIISNLKSNKVNSSNLSSHLDYQVELMDYEKIDNDFVLSFNEYLLNSVYDGKLKEEVKYALSYSIYDSYGSRNVVFQVNSSKIDEFRLEK